MSNSILTRDGNYLQLFNSAIRVNKNLKKWKQAESETSTKEDDPDAISLSNFLNLSNRDFNIYLNKTVKNKFKKNGWLVEEDGVEITSMKHSSNGKQGVIKRSQSNTILFTLDAILADTEETAIGKAVKAFKAQNPEHLISQTIATNQNIAIQSIEGVDFVDYEYQTVTEKS